MLTPASHPQEASHPPRIWLSRWTCHGSETGQRLLALLHLHFPVRPSGSQAFPVLTSCRGFLEYRALLLELQEGHVSRPHEVMAAQPRHTAFTPGGSCHCSWQDDRHLGRSQERGLALLSAPRFVASVVSEALVSPRGGERRLSHFLKSYLQCAITLAPPPSFPSAPS